MPEGRIPITRGRKALASAELGAALVSAAFIAIHWYAAATASNPRIAKGEQLDAMVSAVTFAFFLIAGVSACRLAPRWLVGLGQAMAIAGFLLAIVTWR
jgi:hypothetical protein